MKIAGFDNDAYVKMQSEKITERIAKFGGKLYLEFGGKLFDDFHASRVLPGFKPDSKIVMLSRQKSLLPLMLLILKKIRSARISESPMTWTFFVLSMLFMNMVCM